MPSVLRKVQSANAQMISAPPSRMIAVRRPEEEIRYVFINTRIIYDVVRSAYSERLLTHYALRNTLKHRKLFHPRLFRLRWWGSLGGLTFGLGQELGQAAKVGLDQRTVLWLVQRSGGVHHRHNQPATYAPRLTVNPRNLLAGKPLGHRETPKRDDHARINRSDLAF